MQTDEYRKMRELEDHYWWFVARRHLAIELVADYGAKAGRVLDVGCGTGAVMERLQARSWTAGVDFSSQALTFSHER
ncbi:MAG: class I SAM-dependent methyltransferase, partial [Armatimonadota bacterium]